MRLDTPLINLNGVGDKHFSHFTKNNLHTVKDLLYYLPRAYQNRGDVKSLDQEEFYDEYHSYILTIGSEPKVTTLKRGRGLSFLKFKAFDETGSVNITYFNQNYLKDIFHIVGTFRFWGKVKTDLDKIDIFYLGA